MDQRNYLLNISHTAHNNNKYMNKGTPRHLHNSNIYSLTYAEGYSYNFIKLKKFHGS